MKPVTCFLCPRRCVIIEGARGNCRVRTNVGGKLFSLVYGKPCSVHIDPIEKKPFFHILPGSRSFSLATAGCNLHCLYCQNWEISQRPPEETENIDLVPDDAVSQALRHDCRSLAYTYSDPVIFYEYAEDIAARAKKEGLLNLLVTAGYIEQDPLIELCRVSHGANLTIKGMTEDFYKKMCGATLKPVLDAAVTMRNKGLWLEVTNLIVPTWNDTDNDIRTLCRWVKDHLGKDTPLHFSRFWPMHKLLNLPPTPESTITRAWDIGKAEGLSFVYVGNLPDHPGNNTFCPTCQKIIIGRQGFAITENHLNDGTCGHCKAVIPGIWK
ncbi:MAG: AmmeMemoRadiSam system radical SAM enzyme [Candidatus Omnitrophica bacterium]|nr:AmmeMemoRadiSam system radical SAM enzyme [Candidatus Omnitrophota bacterium]